ncbi:MAG: hypothetical protein LBI03_06245 [Clostridiales bacterium]|jgi:hypothetical protein|nr:hypothetical protein [Clostridiales bacterium]
MSDTNVLCDSYQRSGTDLSELKEVLTELDAMTSLKTVSTLDIELLSLDRRRVVDGKQIFKVFEPLEGEKNEVSIPCSVHKILAPMMQETQNNRLLLRIGGKIYFTSYELISTMATRVDLGGTGLFKPSNRRDAYIAELFGVNEKEVRLVMRNVGSVFKIYAMFSEDYARIPQTTLLEIISRIKQELGAPVCRFWDVNHNRSFIQLDFPEKAKDFARVYGISERIIPGLKLETSDVGISSIRAVGTWSIGKGKACSDAYTRKHVGNIDLKEIMEKIDNQIFKRYERITKALGGLLQIDVKEPKEAYYSVFKQINLEKIVGKRRMMKIVDLLSQQLNPKLSYTAYDLAKSILALPDTLKGLPKTVLRDLETKVLEAVFADYKEYENELINIAA